MIILEADDDEQAFEREDTEPELKEDVMNHISIRSYNIYNFPNCLTDLMEHKP